MDRDRGSVPWLSTRIIHYGVCGKHGECGYETGGVSLIYWIHDDINDNVLTPRLTRS